MSDQRQSGRVVVIMGPPNAGKDTQAHLLAKRIDAIYIGSGELLRREADPRVMAIMARGELVPPEDFRRLIGKAISEVPNDHGIVLAGIAKRPEEAEWLLEFLPGLNRWIDRVILIEISKEEAILRSAVRSKGRADDHPDVQGERWTHFYQKTKKSLEFFERKGLLSTIDGSGPPPEVARLIDKVLS